MVSGKDNRSLVGFMGRKASSNCGLLLSMEEIVHGSGYPNLERYNEFQKLVSVSAT